MHYSLFAWAMATVSRITILSPLSVLLAGYLGSAWLMLFAARQLLRQCSFSDSAQLIGVALLAAWWTLPIAGTSLVLMDPYTTARSFSTPLSLLAIAYALQILQHRSAHSRQPAYGAIAKCVACLVLATAMHLLMAGYAVAFILVLFAGASRRAGLYLTGLTIMALSGSALMQAAAPSESSAWIAAAITRCYWFLSQWHWFELAGLLGPMIILFLMFRSSRSKHRRTLETLSSATLAAGLISFAIALLFAHESASVHFIARLQPLRIYLLLYALMIVLLGASAWNFMEKQAKKFSSKVMAGVLTSLPVVCIVISAVAMSYAQQQTYPASSQLELPWRTTANPWTRAFLWAKDNTPKNALFALDAHYISAPSEDAQVFRAIALRDVIPDYSKDGGAAAITRSLAEKWQQGMTVQLNLEDADDSKRRSQLIPYGVTWLILQSRSPTAFSCPYNNGTVKVCRLSSSN